MPHASRNALEADAPADILVGNRLPLHGRRRGRMGM